MKEKNIHKIIDLYFEAQLSVAEEKELFQSLLAFKGHDRKVDEALAVMLMARMHTERMPSGMQPKKTRSRILLYGVAAALMAVLCISVLWRQNGLDCDNSIEGMVAYVGGVKISDESEIMKIVDDQLNDIGISSELFAQTVAEDLDDIRNAFNEDDL